MLIYTNKQHSQKYNYLHIHCIVHIKGISIKSSEKDIPANLEQKLQHV